MSRIKLYENFKFKDEYLEFFQDLGDNWDVECGYSVEDKYIRINFEIPENLFDEFPLVQKTSFKSNDGHGMSYLKDFYVCSIQSKGFDRYCKFMLDLHKCLNHFLLANPDFIFVSINHDEEAIMVLSLRPRSI